MIHLKLYLMYFPINNVPVSRNSHMYSLFKIVYNIFMINTTKQKTSMLLTLFILAFVLFIFPEKTSAGGGPQFVCKDMAQKQGWLIDNTKFDEELSSNACISRNPTNEEKDKILEFCKAEEKGEFRTDCLDKCRKYYSEIEFRECNKNEVTSMKYSLYTSNLKSILNSPISLQQTIFISLLIITFSCIVVAIVKKLRKSPKAD